MRTLGWRGALVLLLACCAFPGVRAWGGIIYVRAGAPGGGDGANWASAYTDLQSALSQAGAAPAPKPEIRVAGGVYRPDSGSGNRSASFELFSGAVLKGGYAGTGSDPDLRDPLAFPSILSGDIGTPGDPADNSRHVVSFRVLSAPATLDGFVIADGNADGVGFPDGSGGGLLNEGNITVTNCLFRDNFAENGGGVFSRFGAPLIEGCTFESNQASKEGGGAFVRNAGMVRFSEFVGNTAAFGGGAAICCGTVEIRSSRFVSNFASLGGGVYSAIGSVRIVGSVFESNTASKGGGLFTAGTGVVAASCFFGNNTATDGGGSSHSGQAKVVNCVYSRNSALGSGGAIYLDGTLTLANSTLARGNALLFGGGLYATGATTTLSNSIAWGNTDSQGPGQNAQVRVLGGSITPQHNCIQGWTGSLGGVGNFSQDPLFQNPNGPDGLPGTPDDDYRLVNGSPCIDAGDNLLVPPDSADLDQNGDTLEPTPIDRDALPRISTPFALALSSAVVDLGAHELQSELSGVPGDANGDGVVDFNDIVFILVNWGATDHQADLDGSGFVDFGDITAVLANWNAL